MSQQPKSAEKAFYPLSSSSPGTKDRFADVGASERPPGGYFPATQRRPQQSQPFPSSRWDQRSSRWDAFASSGTASQGGGGSGGGETYNATNASSSRYVHEEQEQVVNEKAYDRTEPCIPYESIPKNLLTHLHGSWCLWYTNVAQKTPENFSNCLIPICVVSTAEAFWALYSHCIRPSQLPRGTEYHLFREGIKPMWEDPANQNGGTLMLRLKKDKDYLDYFWEALILAMIGEQLGEDVNGAVAGKRYADDHLSVWNRHYDPKNQKAFTAHLLRVLRLPEDGPAEYKSHSGFLKNSSAHQT